MYIMSSSDSSSSNEEITADFALLLVVSTAATSPALFGATELNSENQSWVDPSVGVRDYLETVRTTPNLFKTVTNFTASESEGFC